MKENEQALRQENKMGVMPMNRLILTMSAPIMLSMLVQALYNVVDSFFVSHVSENAFNAVSLAFPVQSLMIAVAVGTGVGVNAVLSRSLGEKNYERANLVACNGIFLSLCSYAVFALMGAFFSHAFFAVQTDVPEIVEGGSAYLAICSVFSVGFFVQIIMERLLQATGRSFWSMVAQLTGAVLNIILDPVFIFGLDMGIIGAALATVIGQIVGMILAVYLNIKKNHDIVISFKGFRPDRQVIRAIYAIGVPSIAMQAINAIVTFFLNQILLVFSTTATGVLGAYFKLQSFVFMPIFGLNNGMVPIIAYNYGAKNPERMSKALKLGMAYALIIMSVGCAIFQIFPDKLLGIFDASPYMMSIGVPALRIASLSFAPAGFSIIASGLFQALGHGVMSLMESLVRQVVVLLPAAWLLSLTGNVNLVWFAFPFAVIFSVLVCVIALRVIYVKEFRPLIEAAENHSASHDAQ